MRPGDIVAGKIREIIASSPGCSLNDIINACHPSTCKRILFEVARLSRIGVVITKPDGSTLRFYFREVQPHTAFVSFRSEEQCGN
jgi:hypothetical protein